MSFVPAGPLSFRPISRRAKRSVVSKNRSNLESASMRWDNTTAIGKFPREISFDRHCSQVGSGLSQKHVGSCKLQIERSCWGRGMWKLYRRNLLKSTVRNTARIIRHANTGRERSSPSRPWTCRTLRKSYSVVPMVCSCDSSVARYSRSEARSL
jgi:hypothetical protein